MKRAPAKGGPLPRPGQNDPIGYDSVIVGSGPNGLSAAVELTRSGRRVLVVEQSDQIGGGARSAELTLPGFLHDICSAIHPFGAASPFFNEIHLDLDWIHPPVLVSHPLPGGHAAALLPDVAETAAALGPDRSRYQGLMTPLVTAAADIVDDFLGPLRPIPRHPIGFARFAGLGVLPASILARRFETDAARGLLAGLAAHAIAPLNSPATGGVALILALVGHAYGWPVAGGGSGAITQALARRVIAGGGEIEAGRLVSSMEDIPPAPIVLFDLMPRSARAIAPDRVSTGAAGRGHRAGPGVFKVDWALSGPIPWTDEWSGRAGTVHVGGTWEEVASAEAAVHEGRHPERPFVLVAQQSLFDPSRAPAGLHTAWGYCHVPNGSSVDMTGPIESQIERFAPGFRDLVLARHTMDSPAFATYNPNYVGGDIGGGKFGLRRILRFGPVAPYRLGDGLYLCSSATPPGAGVHGMCGYHAARAVLARGR